jgi:hypothetical protein
MFDFLGFTHSCGRTRKGHFTVRRETAGKRMRAKLQTIKQQLRKWMHDPVNRQVAAVGRARLLQLPCDTGQQQTDGSVPGWGQAALVAGVTPPRAAAALDLGATRAADQTVASIATNSASVFE